ncbi:MAG: DUF4097 family beta strand repeat-containing protein [Mycobacterium sp.]
MPTFPTPDPITAVIEVVAGSVHLVATDRDDTVVDVRPRDPNRSSDIRAAEQTRVDFRNGTLTVSAGRRFVSLGRGGAVTIDVELPSRSRLQASAASADVRADGEFAEFRFASASGDVIADSVTGNVKADTASGDMTAQSVTGSAVVATASGGATIGDLDGDVKFRTASGSLKVGRLHGTVNAQTASGDVTVATAINGTVSVQSSSGEVEVGIAEGTAARLDLRTGTGRVRNNLNSADGPAEGDETLDVLVRTASGDIGVQRATGPAAA